MHDTSTIILLRHGEPCRSSVSGGQASTEKIFRGVTDDSLTSKGWQQMSKALSNLLPIDQVFTSPLKRCSEFSHQYCSEHTLPIQVCDELKEINFGQWDGQLVEKVAEKYPKELKQFWETPLEFTPPDGEPVLEFKSRIISIWNELLSTHRGKTCLIVAHGGVQKMILAEVLKMPIEAIHSIEVPYACCSTIKAYYHDDEYLCTLKSHICLTGE